MKYSWFITKEKIEITRVVYVCFSVIVISFVPFNSENLRFGGKYISEWSNSGR